MNGIAHSLFVATQGAGNHRHTFTSITGKQNLTSAEDKGIRRAQTDLHGLLLGVIPWAHRDGGFHTLFYHIPDHLV
jgi:hypothetical protein